MDIEMIDYIEATKHFECKNTPFFGYCIHSASYSSGWEKYHLKGCEKIEIWHNQELNMLRFKGSVMYYLNGHNFIFSKSDFVQGINMIGNIIHANLWDAILDVLEYGTIIETPQQPRHYITHHKAGKGLVMEEKSKDNGRCRFYNDSLVNLKMYDAGRNIMHKQGITMQEIIKESGWNPQGNYLKWEAHYRKPEKVLNHGIGIRLEELMHPDWDCALKADLYSQYKRLIPMKSIVTPTTKKELSSSSIILYLLAETKVNDGTTLDELKKLLYDKINAIPDEILTKADKDSRKRQIKTMLAKIQEAKQSEYDLSDMLVKSLEAQ